MPSKPLVPGRAEGNHEGTKEDTREFTSGRGLQFAPHPATIGAVENSTANAAGAQNPFRTGAIVLVMLSNPRDKFWGAIYALSLEGLSICGFELASFDDVVSMVRDGEVFSPGVVFFPMHRVERIELDLANGEIPSIGQRFAAKTGLEASAALMRYLPSSKEPR